jgi:hypothetical protein
MHKKDVRSYQSCCKNIATFIEACGAMMVSIDLCVCRILIFYSAHPCPGIRKDRLWNLTDCR